MIVLAARRVLPAHRALATHSPTRSSQQDDVASLESVAALEVPDSVVLDTVALDTVEALGMEEEVPHSVDMVPDSIDMVPDSVESMCPRCGTFHVGGVFGEECFQARREARRTVVAFSMKIIICK